jgi:uncharacterized membrane protein (DUF2068 family)
MRLVPRRWSSETLVCSLRAHVTPADQVERLRTEDAALGFETEDGNRLCRCLRCDAWILATPPQPPCPAVLPNRRRLPRPRRGRQLDDAILLRVIALERAIHAVIFGVLSIGLVIAELGLPWLREQVQDIVDQTGRGASQSWLIDHLARLADVKHSTITLLLVVALVYCAVEATEAIGLWREKRWAEYLTVLATAGLLPFELRELSEKTSMLRLTALGVNVAILVYLLWAKRLFGLRGGTVALRRQSERSVDWDDLLTHPPVRAS